MSNTFEQQQAAAASSGSQTVKEVFATTPRLKTAIQVAQNDRGANAHHDKQFSCRLEPSRPFYGRFSVQNGRFGAVFKMIVLKTQADPCSTGYVFPLSTVVPP